jgi:uncharacterized membrane protein YgdD (TMEM256/DUF423 family)
MVNRWLSVAFVLFALGVACGAFGAHALAARLDERSLELWHTATRYLVYGAVALGLAGVAGTLAEQTGFTAGAASLLVGTLIFWGTVAALALGAPRWLGAVTPIGGVGMIAGLLLLAWAAWGASVSG